jgi:acetyl-CoA carboxylase biotin carboxyl carrier protein
MNDDSVFPLPEPFSQARLNEIEAVAAVLRDSAVLTEIEVRQGDAVLRVRRSSAGGAFPAPARLPRTTRPELPSPRAEAVPFVSGEAFASGLPLSPTEDAGEMATAVTAGLVGIFHALRPPLASGDRVAKGQVVGQIEAMRLMNDVAAPAEGIVAAVHVEEGQPVEYGQALFDIVPATPGEELL